METQRDGEDLFLRSGFAAINTVRPAAAATAIISAGSAPPANRPSRLAARPGKSTSVFRRHIAVAERTNKKQNKKNEKIEIKTTTTDEDNPTADEYSTSHTTYTNRVYTINFMRFLVCLF